MRILMLLLGLLAAAAIGAFVTTVILRPFDFNPGPGGGGITCPGSDACPENRGPPDRRFQGIAFKSADVTSGTILICDGVTANGCPDGYVGYLVRHRNKDNPGPNDPKNVDVCHGSAPCRSGFDMIYCRNAVDTKPAKGCPVLPQLQDPGW